MSWLDAKPEAAASDASPTEPKRERVRMVRGAPLPSQGNPKTPAPKEAREQSTIAFPYMDLEAGISVARAIIGSGGVALSRDQLAGVMNLSAGSGNFVTKVATARLFGVIATVGGKYELTNLGFSIVDSNDTRQRAARAEAFLNVQLYKRTYEEFRGKQLPPRPHGLEQAFHKFGVSSKQIGNARLAFERSARQAGYFNAGEDRLILPIVGNAPSMDRLRGEVEETPEPTPLPVPVAAQTYHPFIQGLLDALPEPGTNWALEGRALWLQAAAFNFNLMYKGGEGQITVTASKVAKNHDDGKS
jgi:hypothetical protein